MSEKTFKEKMAEAWNKLTPAQRLEIIDRYNKLNPDLKIGKSNSECTFSKLSNKCIAILDIYYSLKFKSESSDKKDGLSKKDSKIFDASKILRDKSVHVDIKKTTKVKKPKATAAKEIAKDLSEIYDEIAEEKSETVAPFDGSLDLAISFDDTGSMHTVRQIVRQNIIKLVKELKGTIPLLRIALIIHNDYCDSPKEIFVQDFTDNVSKIESFVNQSSPCGGGDAPECYELALHSAKAFNWKSNQRAFIVIGDEVPHHVGYSYFNRKTGRTEKNTIDWKNEVAELRDQAIKIYGIQALGRKSSTSFYDYISRMTGGVKLDLSQFSHISTYINAVAFHQSGNLQAYEDSDPTFSANLALKNMFAKLKGFAGVIGSDKIETLSKFQVMDVKTSMEIRHFVEANGLTFRKGKGYYQLIARTADGKANSEIVQENKEVLFVDKSTGETIDDTYKCRKLLGVPYGTKGTVRPLSIPSIMDKYDIFIQSNSYNRKLDAGVRFLYELDHI